jgi:Mg-chelatase subunit ChlD
MDGTLTLLVFRSAAHVVLLALVSAGCAVKIPQGIAIPANLHLDGRVRVEANVRIAPTVVAMENAPVPEFFGIPIDGAQDVIFVLDVSGSMADAAQGPIAQLHSAPPPPQAVVAPRRKIDIAQDELVELLQRLPDGTRLNVLFFNAAVEGFAAEAVVLDANTRDTMMTFVKMTEPTGATALTPAMRTAFLLNAKRIVLLSDGLGNVGPSDDVLVRDAREAIRGGVRIDTIGLGTSQDAALLGTLARESGGLYQPL